MGHRFRRLATQSTEVIDTAANGRSSKSFIAEGRWREALEKKGGYYLIQFGHNDEPGKGPDRERTRRRPFGRTWRDTWTTCGRLAESRSS